MNSEVIQLLQKRVAGRSIEKDPLTVDVIDVLVEAARLTPSCRNHQPWRYLFLNSDEGLKKGRECLVGGNTTWATRAPLLIIGYSRHNADCIQDDGREYFTFDLGMSTMNIMLAATELGLSARPMAGFSPEKVRTLFALEDVDEPYVMIAVGKPGSDESFLPEYYKGMNDKPRERKAADDLFKVI